MNFKMMRFSMVFMLCISVFFLDGCTKQNTLTLLDRTRVSYPGPPVLTQNSERIMEEAFLETGLPWDVEMVAAINQERIAIIAIQDHLNSKLLVSKDIPYYSFVEKTEEFLYHYAKLQEQLDERSTTPGAMTDQGLELYVRIRADINQELDWQRERLSSEAAKIDKAASKADIDDLKNIYKAVEPLVSMGKKALL